MAIPSRSMKIYRAAKKLLRIYYRIFRPLTLGVRAVVTNGAGEILLVRHKDDGVFYLVGGGVKKGETLAEAIIRETREECGIELSELGCASVYTNFQEYKNDHIIVFTAKSDGEVRPGRELINAGFYPMNSLPEPLSKGMKRRIDEYNAGEFSCGKWSRERCTVDERLKKQLEFLIEIDKMKSVLRQTILIDKSRQETDAEHSWHFAVMALTLCEHSANPDIDINRVIKMALLHDLVEIYAGDTFAYDTDGYEDKEQREVQAADRLFALLPPDQAADFRSLWEEFDAMETPDALYASAIDRLQPFVSNYMTNGHTWAKHGVKKESVYKRMLPVKEAIPELWDFVEAVIADACEKGYIKDCKFMDESCR